MSRLPDIVCWDFDYHDSFRRRPGFGHGENGATGFIAVEQQLSAA